MRGARRKIQPLSAHDRIIPADAGSTFRGAGAWRSCRDHPRGCGEHARLLHELTDRRGSSPRMRGAHRRRHRLRDPGRIIPADAGSTSTWWCSDCPGRDHPRGCGEHGSGQMIDAAAMGSSPRMRGARSAPSHAHPTPGIIPADAGSTPLRRMAPGPDQDHPRGCGEHSMSRPPFDPFQGSSPRMRGSLRDDQKAKAQNGIIPADAGSTRHG